MGGLAEMELFKQKMLNMPPRSRRTSLAEIVPGWPKLERPVLEVVKGFGFWGVFGGFWDFVLFFWVFIWFFFLDILSFSFFLFFLSFCFFKCFWWLLSELFLRFF